MVYFIPMRGFRLEAGLDCTGNLRFYRRGPGDGTSGFPTLSSCQSESSPLKRTSGRDPVGRGLVGADVLCGALLTR